MHALAGEKTNMHSLISILGSEKDQHRLVKMLHISDVLISLTNNTWHFITIIILYISPNFNTQTETQLQLNAHLAK